tara:strand:+ start:1133 stop:1651 length:519 start_codon:yes stop_codon:yes gene_type:complete
MLNVNVDQFNSEKVISVPMATERIEKLKLEGKKVGLCHGGFDLLHPGHVKHFESAKTFCDVLFVSLTSDKFVKMRKGVDIGRPVYPESLRAYMVACIEFVDNVVISDFNLGVDIIKLLKPNLYIKGPDYEGSAEDELMLEKEAIKSVNGEIIYTKDVKLSTTDILDYVKHKL